MKKIIPIIPSTGGTVSIPHIIGRTKEIKDFWKILEKQGIALFAERRFGKSSILRKMEKEVKEGFVPIYQPVQGISTIESFAATLMNIAKEKEYIDEGFFKKLENIYNTTAGVIDEIQTVKFKKLEHPWQKQLYYLFKKLIEKNRKSKIVIMLDEFSLFLDNLQQIDAIMVVGFLRDITLQDEFINIRFVYCGSIGIDLVLDKIKKGGHNIGDPLNHMRKYELLPFEKKIAEYFGNCLNEGCKTKLSNRLIELICKRANNIPYFIDIAFYKISELNASTQEIVDKVFEDILDDTSGKESIKHFYDRIEQFYPNYKLSINILNFISKNKSSSPEAKIADYVLLGTEDSDRIEINREIERLRNDGYLLRTLKNEERLFDFKYSLLKSWWKRNKAF